jgi:chitinase
MLTLMLTSPQGQDYKQIPNDQKVQEIDQYPLLLKEIKAAIGDKELSIAVPGKEGDMIAFTAEKVPEINAVVDHVNVSTTPPCLSRSW